MEPEKLTKEKAGELMKVPGETRGIWNTFFTEKGRRPWRN